MCLQTHQKISVAKQRNIFLRFSWLKFFAYAAIKQSYTFQEMLDKLETDPSF